ncbi:MAG: ribosome small subunit-dependent GTPase A [Oscillospiraceae bacterium]|nr:ribosome small subunit-dependent GTPase A [Oscillospiraceae bacterium]
MSAEGIIFKALGGFYYVETGEGLVECRARGRFRKAGELTPLVGDRVAIDLQTDGSGYVVEIRPRRNAFVRPQIANIDAMVIVISAAIPVCDPYLVDRMTAIAARNDCEPIICINKCDMDAADELFEIYTTAGFVTLRVSAETGEGIAELSDALRGRLCAFTGNTGVGKSSVLNALGSDIDAQEPGEDAHDFAIPVGEVSEKLGRGRHTTRHVELFKLPFGTVIADTPGFSSFDTAMMERIAPEEVQLAFPDFAPYRELCRFQDCIHVKEPGCAVLDAVAEGQVHPSRHASYALMVEAAKRAKAREYK